MKKELTAQIMAVLNQYQICSSEKGVGANLECYLRNKRGLISLLKKHPNWNERAMAVVIPVTATRDIDHNMISQCSRELHAITAELPHMSASDQETFWYYLRKLLYDPQKLLAENATLKHDMEQCGFKYIAGQKTSKAVNKFCRQFKLHEHSNYDAVFAKLADALNPLEIPRKAVLSVHPCDYLQMSSKHNSWSSCHGLPNGDYCGGTLSYMNDTVSMVFYTVDEGNGERELYDKPKVTRVMFFYQGGVLLQSRLYPNDSDIDERTRNRNCVQSILAACLKKPNLWRLDRAQKETDQYVHTVKKHMHYADYQEGYNFSLSFLKSYPVYSSLVIGHNGFCFYCGKTLLHGERGVVCNECSRLMRCEECGTVVEKGYGVSIDGEQYCRLCVETCDQCGDNVARSKRHAVHPSLSEEMHVCGRCKEQDYFLCAGCNEHHHNTDQHKQDEQVYCSACFTGLNGQQSDCDNVIAIPELLRRAS